MTKRRKRKGYKMVKKQVLESVIKESLRGGDFAEIFLENRFNNSYSLIGGKVDRAISGIDRGLGLRIIKGYESIYLYTNDLSEANLIRLAKEGVEAFQQKHEISDVSYNRMVHENRHHIIKSPLEIKAEQKIDVMKRLYHTTKAVSSYITQVVVNYADYQQDVLILNSEGLWAEDKRVRTRLAIQSIAEKDGVRQMNFDAPGAHRGFEFYENMKVLENLAYQNGKTVVNMLSAEECPSKTMPVIIENGFGGVVFHEACGHSLEATSVSKGHSVFSDRLGDLIAAPCVTAIDDGTIPNAWGSANIDDEGNLTQKNVLIEKGVLKNYLIDKLGARRMHMKANGCGRRESYRFAPTSRMSNTYIAKGTDRLEDMVSEISYGLYAKKMGGGSVDPTTGAFNFAVTEGYLIENGKITKPVRGATLIGKGEEVLKKIDRVSDNLEFGQGMCGSSSGSIPADVGQPAIRVSEIVVGGRKENANE